MGPGYQDRYCSSAIDGKAPHVLSFSLMSTGSWKRYVPFANQLRHLRWRARNGLLLHYFREKKWQEHVANGKDFEAAIQPGVKLRLSPGGMLAEYIFLHDFEKTERQFLNDFLAPGEVFVDIGANIGLFTTIAGRLVGENGHVHAFEPATSAYQALLANVSLNRLSNVSCYQVAISDRCGTQTLNVALSGFDAFNSFVKPVAGENFGTEEVQCSTWEAFARAHGLVGRVTMMKIDVEGWESYILAGSVDLFARTDAPLLQVEFTDAACQSAGTSSAELYSKLEELGYRMFTYDPRNKRMVPDPLRKEYPYLNLFALKDLDMVQSKLKRRQLWLGSIFSSGR